MACALVGLGMAARPCVSSGAEPNERKFTAAELDFFETKIRPVLVERCYECHAANSEPLQGGLRLDSREGLLAGGDSGQAISFDDASESILLEALRYESFEMPPDGRLPEDVIADFVRWIEMGLPDPRVSDGVVARSGIDLAQGKKFWCFQPIRRHVPPVVANQTWPLNAIDRFVLAQLEKESLSPAAAATRAVWLRRVTFDLVGLPPTVAELRSFIGDDSPDGYERVVDRLLASPHFGERWGRHWLDVARFAESSGGGRSLVFPDAWRYRDYVINSFNQDKPLDTFIIEQIAGDLLPYSDAAARCDRLVATAYLLLGAHNYEEQDKRALEMDVVDEQLDAIGRGLLGMTIACARCHDHKFDPIPTADYYALAGILRSTHVLDHANVSKWTTCELPVDEGEALKLEQHRAQLADLKQQLAAAKKQTGADRKKKVAALAKQIAAAKAGMPVSKAMAVSDAKEVADCAICVRGSHKHLGAVIPRGVLQVTLQGEAPAFPPDQSGRLELARWLASTDNPLTARVYVNRVWHYLFGAGLVRTVDNFGTTGELPSHPELLDELAGKFIADGWSTKKLVREIVLSQAYRMSSEPDDHAVSVDPENRLLGRMNRRRLDAESLRDAMLAASGQIDLRVGGSNIPADVLANSSPITPAEYGFVFADTRRSVYTPGFRNRMHEVFEVFDFADQNRTVGARSLTTTAPQALLMLNGQYVMNLAKAAAARALKDTDLSNGQRIERAFLETLGRPPSPQEASLAAAAVETDSPATAGNEARLAAWQQLFQSLFACIDFRYLD